MNQKTLYFTVLISPLLVLSGLVSAGNRNISQAQAIATQKCSACHGIDGNSKNAQWPSIAGLNEKYILKQLKDFKNGSRISPEMESVVKSFESDKELAAFAKYFSKQKVKPISSPIIRSDTKNKLVDLKLGKELFSGKCIEYGIPACTACHGHQGQGGIDKKGNIYPRLINQYEEYNVKQLKLFRANKRINDSPAMMRNIALMMDDEDIESVAAYIASLGKVDK